jgi:hypothetical protein
MVRGGRGGKAVLTRYEVGDGEDGERPPHGARLGLLDQIVHALHPLPHLRLRGGGAARGRRGRRGRAWSGGGLPPRDSPSTEKKAGPGVAARRPRRRFLISEFFFFVFFWIFRDVPEWNQPFSSGLVCTETERNGFVWGRA